MKLTQLLPMTLEPKRELLLVFFLLAGAYVLRIYRIEERLLWHADTARDALVARHIARYDEELQLGHTAYGLRISGKRDVFDPTRQGHYPTDYYYFLALFWRLSDDVFTVARLVALWQVLGLGILYMGVRKATQARHALFVLGLCSISTASMLHSHTVGTIQMALPLVFMSFTLTVAALKTKRPSLLLLAGVTAISSTAFHYAGVVCAGIVFLVGMTQMTFSSPRQHALHAAALLALIVAGLATLHIQLVQYFGWEAVRESVQTFASSGNTLKESFTQLYLTLEFRLSHFYPSFTWVFAVGSLVIAALAYRKSEMPTKRLLIFCFGFIALLCGLVLTRDRDVFHFEQIMFIDYAYLALLGISLSVLTAGRQRSSRIAFGSLVLVYGYSLTQHFTFLPNTERFLPIQAAQAQAASIIREVPDLEKRMVVVSSYYSHDWESSTIVFWLEKMTAKKLVSLRNTYNNFGWSPEQQQQGVFLCQRSQFDPQFEQNACQYFLSRALQQYRVRVSSSLTSTPSYHGYLVRK